MSDEAVPEGWASAPLGELLEPGGLFDGPFGSHLKTSDYTAAGVRVIRLENLSNLRFVEEKRTYISKGKYITLKKHTVVEGDLLFGSFLDDAVRVSMLPALDTPAIAKADCFCIRPQRALLVPRYLMFQLGANRTKDALLEEVHGATRPRVTTRQLRQLEILIAPLAEQKRIVTKVEELLARVNVARERLARVPAILKRFRQAVLAAACEGRLTEEWRGPGTEPWSGEVSLGDFLSVRSGFAFASKDFQSVGIPVVRQGDLARSGIDLQRCKRVPESYLAHYAGFALSKGDILVGMSGAIGKLSTYSHDMPALQNQRVGRLAPKAGLAATYLALLFEYLQPDLQARGKGMGVSNVSAQDIEALRASFPPLSEQREIVHRVEALFKLADALEKRIAVATARAGKVTQAILARAFRGELVPTEAEVARRRAEYQRRR